MRNEATKAALRCLGNSPEAVWAARRCAPFEFGHEKGTGRSVQVSVYCSDVCPHYTRVRITYVEDLSWLQCLCIGSQPHHESGFGSYIGCTPGDASHGPDFKLETTGPTAEPRIASGYNGTRARAMGFWPGRAVEAVDGVEPEDSDTLEHLLNGLPTKQPGSITFRPTHRGSTGDLGRKLHYVSKQAMAEIARVAESVGFASIRGKDLICKAGQGGRVQVGERWTFYDPTCPSEATERVGLVVEAIRRAASDARPRVVTEPLPRSQCEELRTLPVEASLWDANEWVEVRYIDWLVR